MPKRIERLRAKLQVVSGRCKRLRKSLMEMQTLLRHCEMVRDELRAMIEELSEKKDDRDST